MVMHRDVEKPSCGNHLLGDPTVVGTRRGIAAGMVVHEDDGRRALCNRLTENFARVNKRGVQDAAGDADIARQPVLRIQNRHMKLLDRQILERRCERAPHIAWCAQRLRLADALSGEPTPKLQGGMNGHRSRRAESGHVSERGQRTIAESPQGAARPREHVMRKRQRGASTGTRANDEREEFGSRQGARTKCPEAFTGPIGREQSLRRHWDDGHAPP